MLQGVLARTHTMMHRTLAFSHKNIQLIDGLRKILSTEQASEKAADIINSISEIKPEDAVRAALLIAPYIADLTYLLIEAPDDHFFITCDNPVVKVNPFLEEMSPIGSTTGLYRRGLIIYVPLSPKKSLLLYDGEVYRKCKGYYDDHVVCTTADVRVFNDIVYQNAHESLFSNSSTHLRSLTTLSSRKSSYVEVVTETLLTPGENERPGNLIRASDVDVRLRSGISMLRVRKDAKRERIRRMGQRGHAWYRDESRRKKIELAIEGEGLPSFEQFVSLFDL